MVEQPTIWINGHHPFSVDVEARLEEKVTEMEEQDREAFFAMANSFPEVTCVPAAIFMTNSFDMSDHPDGDASAIYCAIGKLNHSCVPNAQQTHIPETSEEVLIASRTVECGEELCDCYIDLRQSRTERRKELRELFRFDCNCSACSINDPAVVAADDARRKRAKQLDETALEVAAENPYLALDIALDSVKLLSQEQCLPWSIRYLAEAHLNVYMIASSLGKKTVAFQHLQQAHHYNIRLQGPCTPETKRTAHLLREFKK